MPRVDMANARAEGGKLDAAELSPEDGDGAAGRVPERAAQRQERRLAGSVRADQRPVLTDSDAQVDVLEQVSPGSGDPDVVQLQNDARVDGGGQRPEVAAGNTPAVATEET